MAARTYASEPPVKITLELDQNAIMTVSEMRCVLARTLSRLRGEAKVRGFQFHTQVEPLSVRSLEDAGNNEASASNVKRRNRTPKNGAYVTCAWLAEKTGYSADTIRKRFVHEKGVDKRTYSGRNRKVYTIMRISKIAAKRMFPELEL